MPNVGAIALVDRIKAVVLFREGFSFFPSGKIVENDNRNVLSRLAELSRK